MAVTYFYRDTNSDLVGDPSTIGNFEATRDAGGLSSQINTGNLNEGVTASCFFFTVDGDPGTDGTSTGDFIVELRITVQNANIGMRVYLERFNSSGVSQSSQIEAAEGSQTAGAAARQYNWTDPNLGSWAAGDRLGVRVQFTNTTANMNQSCRLGANLETDTIITPFTAGAEPNEGTAAFAVNATAAATGEAPTAGAADGTAAFTVNATAAVTGAASHSGSAALTANTTMAATGEAPSGGPTGLVATPVSTTQIDLEWDAFTGALGYSIERDDVVIASDVQTLTYEDSGLEPNTEYKYRVGAEVSA